MYKRQVFDNKHIGRGSDFMSSLEDNILEPRIYDLIKEESRKHKTDSLDRKSTRLNSSHIQKSRMPLGRSRVRVSALALL